MKKTTFQIGGMHCASCAIKNEKVLKKIKGVESASVNFATHSATVEYDENLTNEMSLHEVIIKNGYKVLQHEAGHVHKEKSKKELLASRNRAFISLILAAPAVLISMLSIELPYSFLNYNLSTWIQAILSTIVILYYGFEFHQGMLKQLRTFSANMDTLVSLGTLTALIYSLWAMLYSAEVYYEIGAIITAFILLGRYFEAKSRGQASEAIEKLLQLGAKTARVIRNNKEINIPIEQVKVGDILLVKPGEKIPVDGKVTEGSTNINESMLTGESMPVNKNINDDVFGATINLSGAIYIKATKVGEDTVLAQIVKMVAEAQSKKAPIQKLVDTISGIFVPIVLVIAVITAVSWYLITGDITRSVIPAVAVLIIACPCALGLATPTAIMVGTGLGARRGIIIKNGESLEKSNKIDVVIFDKTGTLTEGKPKVTNIVPYNNYSEEEVLILAASLEKLSEHPLAQAIVDTAKEKKIVLKKITGFENLAGKGVKGKIGTNRLVLGNPRLAKELKISITECQSKIEKLEKEAKTVVVMTSNNKVAGLIAIADTLKEDAGEAVSRLNKMGINIYMLTGDNQRTANAIATELGIKNVLAEVLPQDKSKKVKELQKLGNKVAFVGDGINDAPALAQSDLGIAIGTGTDIAIESGNIVLVKGNPIKVVEAIVLSKLTFKTIKQNLFWAFFYNLAAIPLAALGLLNPMIAAGAMAFSSVSVVGNSLRIKNKKLI
ncbi:MAG: heavy metal translocating P-type ATPase [Candidatus Nanoarchaeia archaeon]|nr:heavy metal translocating P-type ATPase [Candidatus Nanoarchaeia archaeon]